ncbi:MAG TPA: hypothetical protein VF798_10495, partial [Burkholderiaceae bacterium]
MELVIIVIVTIYTAGAASAAIADALDASAAAAGTATAATAATDATIGAIAGGAIGGAVGSLAGQIAGNVMGIQSGINWGEVAAGAIGGAVGGAVAGEITPGALGTSNSSPLLFATRAVVSDVVTQGIDVATGLQPHFEWSQVAAAGIAAGVSQGLNNEDGISSEPSKDFNVDMQQGVNQFIGGSVAKVLTGGRESYGSIAASAFGTTLGNYAVAQTLPVRRAPTAEELWAKATIQDPSETAKLIRQNSYITDGIAATGGGVVSESMNAAGQYGPWAAGNQSANQFATYSDPNSSSLLTTGSGAGGNYGGGGAGDGLPFSASTVAQLNKSFSDSMRFVANYSNLALNGNFGADMIGFDVPQTGLEPLSGGQGWEKFSWSQDQETRNVQALDLIHNSADDKLAILQAKIDKYESQLTANIDPTDPLALAKMQWNSMIVSVATAGKVAVDVPRIITRDQNPISYLNGRLGQAKDYVQDMTYKVGQWGLKQDNAFGTGVYYAA